MSTAIQNKNGNWGDVSVVCIGSDSLELRITLEPGLGDLVAVDEDGNRTHAYECGGEAQVRRFFEMVEAAKAAWEAGEGSPEFIEHRKQDAVYYDTPRWIER